LLSGLLMDDADDTIPREYRPYDGPIPRTRRFPVIRYYGSIVQIDLQTPLLLPAPHRAIVPKARRQSAPWPCKQKHQVQRY
jgi:hypothetical protein